MSNKLLCIEKEKYEKWINELGERFRKNQIKASVSVNKEMLRFYWDLGCDIYNLRMASKWGDSFFDTLSKDLKRKLPNVTQKMLTNQLRSLEEDNLIYRTVYPETPPKVEYGLTEIGTKIIPVLEAMHDYGEEYIEEMKNVECKM